MGRCKKFPGNGGLKQFLNTLEVCRVLEEIEYKQQVSTDKTQLVTIKESAVDFTDNLANKIVSLTCHHFTAVRECLPKIFEREYRQEEECIFLGDFAENYSFIVQDAAQGFH